MIQVYAELYGTSNKPICCDTCEVQVIAMNTIFNIKEYYKTFDEGSSTWIFFCSKKCYMKYLKSIRV